MGRHWMVIARGFADGPLGLIHWWGMKAVIGADRTGGCSVVDDSREPATDPVGERGESPRATARQADQTFSAPDPRLEPSGVPDPPALPEPLASDGPAHDSAGAAGGSAEVPESAPEAPANPRHAESPEEAESPEAASEREAPAAERRETEDVSDEAAGENGESAEAPPSKKSDKMDWYILKVQSNRE